MARAAKPSRGSTDAGFSLFEPSTASVSALEEEDLPRDEAGRAKIKQQYVELLGIRVQKLRGRILNRERINKTLEGVYYVCSRCANVCHNLDNGLVEDDGNTDNMCDECHKVAMSPAARPVKKAAKSKAKTKAKTKATGKKSAAAKSSAAKELSGEASVDNADAGKASPGKATSSKASASKTAKVAAKTTKKAAARKA